MKTLITCHANADFDAFAAMVAARHLYPQTALYFPGTQERSLQDVFQKLARNEYRFVTKEEIQWQRIERLVLVDTRQRGRLTHVDALLGRKDIKVEAWDHHPASADDLAVDVLHLAFTGAVTTNIIKVLREVGIKISPEEATLLGLGVYSDTGSFTYSSTTAEDFEAAAWLLAQGMDLNILNDMAAQELTSLHIHILNSLLESAVSYQFNNVPVVIAETSMEHYLGDFAHLANRLMEMEKFQVLFALGIMGDRIQVVARSRNQVIDVGKVCAMLGGGGHAYAASAAIRKLMVAEVKEKIIEALCRQTPAVKRARDYMSSPAIGISASSSLKEAEALMLHFGLKAVPIFEPGKRVCVGLLDAQIASRACGHGLGEECVAEYMQRRVITLPPDADLGELTEAIVGARQRLIPIVSHGLVQGVVTRTDLINVFASAVGNQEDIQESSAKQRDLGKMLEDRLPAQTFQLLRLAGKIGRKLGLPVYAVGGFVRDLLLNRPNQDIDLVVEGNGITLARALAEELGGRVREHEKFLTSVIIYHNDQGDECRIDVATTRLEYYEHPAALPTVELSSLKMDLFRRDFSINALAIRLDDEPFGLLVDFFGGRRDIKDKLIRVLHTLSFVEDPTRALRAVRFEQRYGFRIGPGTEKLIKNILPLELLKKLSSTRLFNEVRHICDEEKAPACLERLDELGILQALGISLVLSPSKRHLLERVKDVLAWYKRLYFDEAVCSWQVYFLTLNHHLNYGECSANYTALGLPPARKAEFMSQREILRNIRHKLYAWQRKDDAGHGQPSEFCELLAPLTLDFLLFLMASTESRNLEKSLSLYIIKWRKEKADISGDDLRRLGLAPGPQFATLLKETLKAKLDGKVSNPKSQLAFVVDLLKKNCCNENGETEENTG